MQKLRMLPRDHYFRSDKDDPLPMYYLPFFGQLYRGRIELCLDSLKPGQRILEVGYGSGTVFLNLANMYKEIYGVDLHTNAGSVRQIFKQAGLDVHLCTGNLLELPYDDGFFDNVLCISILEHLRVEQQPLAMAEVRRVLKPGGQFVYGVPAERPLMRFGFRLLGYDIRQHHFSTEQEVADAADMYFNRLSIHHYRPLGSLAGIMYEVGVYERT